MNEGSPWTGGYPYPGYSAGAMQQQMWPIGMQQMQQMQQQAHQLQQMHEHQQAQQQRQQLQQPQQQRSGRGQQQQRYDNQQQHQQPQQHQQQRRGDSSGSRSSPRAVRPPLECPPAQPTPLARLNSARWGKAKFTVTQWEIGR